MSAYGGRGPEILEVSWILMAIATLVVLLRSYVQFFMDRSRSPDMALIWAALAWVLGVAAVSSISVAVHYGYGKHLEIVLARGNIEKASLLDWIWGTLTAIMIFIAKFSVVAFLLAVQGPNHPRQKLIMLSIVGLSAVCNTITVFLLWFQCQPPERLWNTHVQGSCHLAEENLVFGLISAAWGAAVDLYLALYPTALVYSLDIPRKLKALLVFLMGLGVFTAVCSAVKTYYYHDLRNTTDPTYDGATLVLWATAECWVVLIVSGIPPAWPVISKLLQKTNFTGGSRLISMIFLRSLVRSRSSKESPSRSHQLGNEVTAPQNGFARLDGHHQNDGQILPPNGTEVIKTFAVRSGA